MADDISKKIIIEVELAADELTQNITSLNKTIDTLLAKQKQLITTGQQNSATFDDISSKLDTLQKKLQDVTGQVTANAVALNTIGTSAKSADTALSSLAAQQQKNAKAAGDHSAKTKELSGQVNSLGRALNQQKNNSDQSKNALDGYVSSIGKGAASAKQLQTDLTGSNSSLSAQTGAVESSKTAFDAHKITMDHLKTSFDEIKNVSGIFGPSLQEAAAGFNAMKTGLTVVKEGLNGVGAAIKADGFGFLLEILQQIFEYFIHSTEGSKELQGAISAIGVVINKVKGVVGAFMDIIIKAFSHPIDTLNH